MQELGRTQKWLAITAVSFILWEAASAIAGVDNFPHSWLVILDLVPLTFTLFFWKSLSITLAISLFGFLLGSFLALVIGTSITLWNSGEKITRSSINFFRSIPSVVFLPLLIASIGASIRTSAILTTLVVTLMSITYVIRGVQDTDPLLDESTRLVGLNTLDRIRFLFLPSMISTLGTGMRLSASRAFGTVIAAGIITGSPGLGSAMGAAASSANYPRVFSYVIVMGIVGTFIYSGFTFLENRLFRWRVIV
jgi:ABC-type nitrate/sulfonate/bicarbonate transport system permease component